MLLLNNQSIADPFLTKKRFTKIWTTKGSKKIKGDVSNIKTNHNVSVKGYG